MKVIRFLTLSEVLLIYEDQVRRYGGAYGVRDVSLLSSAIYVPQATFERQYLHKSIPEMAAAYAYHIYENHALIDGNKRVALASALVFLDINGFDFECSEDEIYEIMMKVASGTMNKTELTKKFVQFSKKKND
ncbi:type II toxin-antitoxin system death-on-curing family toxin [Gracilinema caldarium]|uniref:Death-on-curing family protein n=1 Tax=Gracilinema caldarium (strain ATCC 51460 / DSM 7334 / H1) TaxID=744872 RepID=F8EWY6_GRAC1|nr:type II toxin-antitoxin system death-on-curing family toxin [Gracilinema caldarium]AEJ18513.1 death-on-curing family protein [Gracilinema caldarium DSM 7334]